MADLKFIAQPATEVACYNGDSDLTVLQIAAPTNQMVKVLGWSISFDGTSVTANPVQVELARQTGAGTMTPLTPVQFVEVGEATQSTALHTATVEPVKGDVLESYQIHPQAGYDIRYPEGQEPIIGGGGRIGIVVLAAAAVNCRVKMYCEE